MERSELERKGNVRTPLGPTWRDKKSPRAALSLSLSTFGVGGLGGLGVWGLGVGGLGGLRFGRGFGCPFF